MLLQSLAMLHLSPQMFLISIFVYFKDVSLKGVYVQAAAMGAFSLRGAGCWSVGPGQILVQGGAFNSDAMLNSLTENSAPRALF